MAWPLRTTGDENLATLAAEVLDQKHPRRFLWTHCNSPEEKDLEVRRCKDVGLVVLDQVPCWFLLACGKRVQKRDRLKMMDSITQSAGQDAWWRGQMFGYPEKDIDWFQEEINAATRRVQKYWRSLR